MAENSKIEFRFARRSAKILGISLEEFMERRMSGQKWCPRCRLWHPVSEFGVDKGNADGLLPFCRKSTYKTVHEIFEHPRGMKGKAHSPETKAKMKAAKTGAQNHNWKGGLTPSTRRARQHAEYQGWRKTVLKRDEGICQRCKQVPETPNVHHIKPFRTHANLATDPDNGMTVCPPCHRAIHAGER